MGLVFKRAIALLTAALMVLASASVIGVLAFDSIGSSEPAIIVVPLEGFEEISVGDVAGKVYFVSSGTDLSKTTANVAKFGFLSS